MSLVVSPEVVRWVAKQTSDFGNFGTDIGIGWERNGELVAGVAYANWNGVNVECHIASKGTNWLTRKYLAVIFDYPFCQLGARRITVCVGQGNIRSRRFVEHLGFTLEAPLKGAHPSGDLLIYVLWKESCKWTSQDYSQRYLKAA